MKYILALWVVLLSAGSFGQSLEEAEHLVHDTTVSLTSPQNGTRQYAMPEFTVEVTLKTDVNAFANLRTHAVVINIALVRILSRAPGELAFVIAHEIGHLADADCSGRGTRAGLRGSALFRMCEASADKIGIQYIMAAGYSPYEAAGLMGKLLMAYPSQNSVIGIVIGRFAADHPVDIDRIKQAAQYAHEACEDRPEMCQ